MPICHAQPEDAATALFGDSGAMRQVRLWLRQAAPLALPVLLQGETGTGKELAARALGRLGVRQHAPFVTLNCGALPAELVGSLLFGHERGAFTGAHEAHAGAFERAHGGTLFLDEIGEMPAPLQAQLLRVLEDGEVQRLGAHRARRVRVRLVAASNRNLGEEAQKGRMRPDLLYRLHVLCLQLPPLRQRPDDIVPLALHFLAQIPQGAATQLHPRTAEALLAHTWPGNVRELRHMMLRIQAFATHPTICAEQLSFVVPDLPGAAAPAAPSMPCAPTEASVLPLRQMERESIMAALRLHAGNRSRAARSLGMSRATLLRRLRSFAGPNSP